jgi:hypothetical protein
MVNSQLITVYCSAVSHSKCLFDLILTSFLIPQSDWYHIFQKSKEKEDEKQRKNVRHYFYTNEQNK